MSNPAPILTVAGRVHSVVPRTVEAAPERPAEHDPETGRVTRAALPARDGYEVVDVTVLTAEGGFATVSILPDALHELGGEIPEAGADVDYAVRCFVSWQRAGSRSFSRVGFSVAGDVTAKRKNSGRRVSPVASAG